MKHIVLAIMLAVLPISWAQADDEIDQRTKVTQHWLELVDKRDYASSYIEASIEFKSRISQEDWTVAIAQGREPMGAVTKRTLSEVKQLTSMPGLPDGQYTVLQFDTSFANKPKAIETITLIWSNGQQSVAGYFIK